MITPRLKKTFAQPLRRVSAGVADTVPRLSDSALGAGDRWVFSAGFNVDVALGDTTRVDEELHDLARLRQAGCRICLLSHHGTKSGTLAPIAEYISERLGHEILFHPDCHGDDARAAVDRLEDGQFMLLGNTRQHPGEERADPALSQIFASYGDRVAIGGFSKAHRSHASNVGILQYLPGVAARSLIEATAALAPWSGRDCTRLSVAALGGDKPEKTTVGLAYLLNTYDYIMIGGAVLNLLLKAKGISIGHSITSENGSAPPLHVMQACIARSDSHKILLPEAVLVGENPEAELQQIPFGHPIPDTHAIYDYLPGKLTSSVLARLSSDGGRLLVAGPPGLVSYGHRTAALHIETALAAPDVDGIVLGGDSANECKHDGMISSGGGAALTYLAQNTTAVIDALLNQPHLEKYP